MPSLLNKLGLYFIKSAFNLSASTSVSLIFRAFNNAFNAASASLVSVIPDACLKLVGILPQLSGTCTFADTFFLAAAFSSLGFKSSGLSFTICSLYINLPSSPYTAFSCVPSGLVVNTSAGDVPTPLYLYSRIVILSEPNGDSNCLKGLSCSSYTTSAFCPLATVTLRIFLPSLLYSIFVTFLLPLTLCSIFEGLF